MGARVARRRDDELDMAAEQRGRRFGRAFEDDGLQVARVAADRFQQERGADLVLTECGGEADRDRLRIVLQALEQVLAAS